MDYNLVSSELSNQLRTIPGVTVLKWDARRINPPAFSIGLPLSVDYDLTFGRGFDQLNIEIFVFIGQSNAEAAHVEVSAYISGTGEKSVKHVLENAEYATLDSISVVSAKPYEVSVGEISFLGVNFEVVVTGPGQ